MNDSLHLPYRKNTRHREADGNATYRRTLVTIAGIFNQGVKCSYLKIGGPSSPLAAKRLATAP